MTEDQGRCIKRYVLSARKSAKFHSSLAEIVQFTARIAFQSARKKVVKVGKGGTHWETKARRIRTRVGNRI